MSNFARKIHRNETRIAGTTHHAHEIAAGRRHPTYQKIVRAVRVAFGLEATASNTHKVHGKTY